MTKSEENNPSDVDECAAVMYTSVIGPIRSDLVSTQNLQRREKAGKVWTRRQGIASRLGAAVASRASCQHTFIAAPSANLFQFGWRTKTHGCLVATAGYTAPHDRCAPMTSSLTEKPS